MTRGAEKRLIPIALILAQVGLLVFFAFARLVDNDEGFYLSAAREVAAGETPYRDFFYPQMPYLPYLFSPFAGHGFATLFATRLASVAAAVLTTLVFYLLLVRFTEDRVTRAIMLAVYVFSGVVISWHSVAKPYPWVDLFLLASFYFLIRFFDSRRIRHLVLSGALAALAVNVRSVVAPVALFFLAAVVVSSGSHRLKAGIAYLGSLAAVSIPAIVLMISDPRRFFFDNIGFHLMRNPSEGIGPAVLQKVSVAGKLLINPQILLLIGVCIAACAVARRNGVRRNIRSFLSSPRGLAGMTAMLIAVVYVLPDPMMQQYFVQAVPFALLASPKGVEWLLHRRQKLVPVFSNRTLAGVLVGVYVLGIVPYGVVFVGAVRDFDGFSTPKNLQKVCETLDETSSGPILSEMPIVPILCEREIIEGTEFLGFEYPLPLTKEEKRHYRLATDDVLKYILDSGLVSYYVVMNQPPEGLAVSAARNYRLEADHGHLQVYRRKM